MTRSLGCLHIWWCRPGSRVRTLRIRRVRGSDHSRDHWRGRRLEKVVHTTTCEERSILRQDECGIAAVVGLADEPDLFEEAAGTANLQQVGDFRVPLLHLAVLRLVFTVEDV